MGTRYFRAGNYYQDVGTSRVISINSSLATQITLNSGFVAMSIYNQGSTALVWGGSGVSVNSGTYLYPSGRIEWEPINDGFFIYMISDSIGTLGLACIEEYR